MHDTQGKETHTELLEQGEKSSREMLKSTLIPEVLVATVLLLLSVNEGK